jgi:L-amino acid N-acyltransferase YncA
MDINQRIVKQLIKAAQKEGCYKLIATSRYNRPKVHKLYTKLGFKKQGLEFRIDF